MIAKTLVKKNRNLSTINKIHVKSDVFDGSVLNGVRQPILFSFVFRKTTGFQSVLGP